VPASPCLALPFLDREERVLLYPGVMIRGSGAQIEQSVRSSQYADASTVNVARKLCSFTDSPKRLAVSGESNAVAARKVQRVTKGSI
jgi:hypothetical protein